MRKVLMFGTIGVVALCVLIALAMAATGGGSSGGDEAANSSRSRARPEATQVPTHERGRVAAAPTKPASDEGAQSDEGNVYGLNQPAKAGDLVWLIRSVRVKQKLTDPIMGSLPANGKWVLVTGAVMNTGSEAKLVNDSDVHLVDSMGREFDASNETFMYIPESKSLFLKQVNPGIEREFEIAFEVPEDARGLVFRAGDPDDLFGGDEVKISLGR